jgi:hypothetical protein
LKFLLNKNFYFYFYCLKNGSLFRNGAEEAGDDWLITDFAREQLEEYLRYREEVVSTSGTGRRGSDSSEEYLRFREGVRSTSEENPL